MLQDSSQTLNPEKNPEKNPTNLLSSLQVLEENEINEIHINHGSATNVQSKEYGESGYITGTRGTVNVHCKYAPQVPEQRCSVKSINVIPHC